MSLQNVVTETGFDPASRCSGRHTSHPVASDQVVTSSVEASEMSGAKGRLDVRLESPGDLVNVSCDGDLVSGVPTRTQLQQQQATRGTSRHDDQQQCWFPLPKKQPSGAANAADLDNDPMPQNKLYLAERGGGQPSNENWSGGYRNQASNFEDNLSELESAETNQEEDYLDAAVEELTITDVPPDRRFLGCCSNRLQSNNESMYNWQATKRTLKERIAFMFNNEVLADVHFIVGRDSEEQRIPAHRFVLSVGSAVFDAMFNSTLATKEDEIILPDVEPSAFMALLRFLYSDEVQIGPETVMTTLYTAKKYAVPALEKHCVDFLKKHLSPDNSFMLLTQARLFDEPQLASLCLETIDKYTPEAINAEGFVDIDIDTLASVLDRDSLRIKEEKLFTAVLRWCECECARQNLPITNENKRSVLGHLLTKIRFPLMTVEEFAQGPAQSGILTDRETVSLFLYFTVNPKPPVSFPDIPRCSMTGKEQIISRFQQIESRWGYSGTSDKIRFIVDRRIFLVGFGLYGSIHGPSKYQVQIQLFHTGTGRLLGSNDVTFMSDGTSDTFRVMFKEPIEVMANTNYTASATLKGLDSHYGTKGLRKVWIDCPNTGGRVTFQFSYAAGNNNGTSVEDGQIPEIIFYT